MKLTLLQLLETYNHTVDSIFAGLYGISNQTAYSISYGPTGVPISMLGKMDHIMNQVSNIFIMYVLPTIHWNLLLKAKKIVAWLAVR
jgi:hypothetical protein